MTFTEVHRRVDERLRAKAGAMLMSIEVGLDRMMMSWLFVAGLASALRIATSPPGSPGIETIAPYLLLILTPFASIVLALRWFADGDRQAQPTIRLARIGRWRIVTRDAALGHRLYGAGGIMVSLLVGILLNVPIRALEYLASMPAVTGRAPSWFSTLHFLMTVDVVLFSSLYAIAFVAALRHVPLFPRLLVAIWLLDLTMQLAIAEMVAATPNLSSNVAQPLRTLLAGNVNKVLISIAIWLPYLLLSARVNLTYRRRLPA